MKRTLMLTTATLVLALPGCGWSPTMDQWIARGIDGCAIERANWDQVELQLAKGLDDRDAKSIDSLFKDITLARDNLLKEVAPSEATTQPAKKVESRWLDDKWIAEAQKALLVQLETMRSERRGMADQIDRARQNVDEMEKAFRMTDKLRKSWGPNADLKANVEYMSSLLEAYLKKEAK